MIQRFKIEDLILQDTSGVVFRALDTESGKTVAVRRFFPFGANGGGLNADEQTAYTIAVSRLAGLNHPALRSVICGGCDPVDGMPFIATEWIEGKPLLPLIEQGPLSPEVATTLITQALEVCELLSIVLAEEAVWVETDLQTIIVGDATSGRSFTFWISPLKWLGGREESRGLESIVTLTEVVMGWTGQIVNDHAGRGLGGWLKWLRVNAATTTLQEARESLAASVGAEPPMRADNLVTKASKPLAKRASSTPSRWIAILLGLLAVGLAMGWYMKRNPPAESAIAVPVNKHVEPAENASQRAAKLRAMTVKADQRKDSILAKQEAAAKRRGGAILWDDHELLVENKGNPVIVEGTVRDIYRRGQGKTIYLLFSEIENRDAARAGIRIGDTSPESIIEKLELFRGKKVRVPGTVNLREISGLNRPDIMIDDISAVEVVK